MFLAEITAVAGSFCSSSSFAAAAEITAAAVAATTITAVADADDLIPA